MIDKLMIIGAYAFPVVLTWPYGPALCFQPVLYFLMSQFLLCRLGRVKGLKEQLHN